MINDITSDAEEGMKKAVDSFKRELQKIRTGRANTSMLDGIKVDYYGTPTPVNQVATVQVVDARLITVKPWEKNMIAVIGEFPQPPGPDDEHYRPVVRRARD